MKKKLTIKFTHLDGKEETISFDTDRGYQWTVEQYSRNRAIANAELVSEETLGNGKQMLFG